MNENIDVPFLWLWSCKGSSNCLNLDQAVLRVRCLPWLRSDSWSTKKWPPSCHREPESPKSPKNIEDDVISCACAVHWLHMRSSWRHNPDPTTNIAERPTFEKRAVHFDRGVFANVICLVLIFTSKAEF